MIRILLIIIVLAIIVLVLSRWVIPFIYRKFMKDSSEIKEDIDEINKDYK